jgi:hypothetical protein
MDGISIYVDDIRTPISQGYVICRNYDEAIDVLKNTDNKIDFISLDHDLGDDSKSGYDICKFIVENNIKIPFINLHTSNPVGRNNMYQLLKNYFNDSYITTGVVNYTVD